jgi:hypothetical protein
VTGPDRERAPHPVTATVRLSSAGLHVIDRWVDALADALLDAGAGDPQVGGSLTGGRIEVRLSVPAEDPADAGAVGADLLREAVRAARTPGVRVLGLSVSAVDPAEDGGAAPLG